MNGNVADDETFHPLAASPKQNNQPSACSCFQMGLSTRRASFEIRTHLCKRPLSELRGFLPATFALNPPRIRGNLTVEMLLFIFSIRRVYYSRAAFANAFALVSLDARLFTSPRDENKMVDLSPHTVSEGAEECECIFSPQKMNI